MGLLEEIYGQEEEKKQTASPNLLDEIYGATETPAPKAEAPVQNRPMTKQEQMIWDRAMLPHRALETADFMAAAPRRDQIEAQRAQDVQDLVETGHENLTAEQVARAQKITPDPLLDIFKKPIRNVPGHLLQAAGGMARIYEETIGKNARLGQEMAKRGVSAAITNAGQAITDEIKAEPGTPKYYLGMALSSVADNMPWLAAGAWLKKASIPLTQMYGQELGTSYEELRESGVDTTKALGGAFVKAGAEVAGEMVPTFQMIKRGVPIMKRMANVMFGDMTGEQFTFLLQAGVDKELIRPNMTWKDFAKGMVDTAIVTGIAGPVQTGVIHGAVKVAEAQAAKESRKVAKEAVIQEAALRGLPPQFMWPSDQQSQAPSPPQESSFPPETGAPPQGATLPAPEAAGPSAFEAPAVPGIGTPEPIPGTTTTPEIVTQEPAPPVAAEAPVIETGQVTPATPEQPKQLPEPETVVEEAVNAAQKDDVPLKVQKKYLLDNIDEAIAAAPEGYNTESKVTIEVPGDGVFNIYNSKTTLSDFRTAVAKKFPDKEARPPAKPSMPSRAPGKRVSGEGASYYNPFRPRSQALIVDKETTYETDEGQRVNTRNIYTSDGFFSDGHYMVKVPRNDLPVKVKSPRSIDKTIKDIVPKKLQPVEIVGEFSQGINDQDPPMAHVVGKDGTEQVFEARYIDAILNRYPNALVFGAKGDALGPIIFKANGDYVGAVMPRRVGEEGKEAEAIKAIVSELRGEPSEGTEEQGAADSRPSMYLLQRKGSKDGMITYVQPAPVEGTWTIYQISKTNYEKYVSQGIHVKGTRLKRKGREGFSGPSGLFFTSKEDATKAMHELAAEEGWTPYKAQFGSPAQEQAPEPSPTGKRSGVMPSMEPPVGTPEYFAQEDQVKAEGRPTPAQADESTDALHSQKWREAAYTPQDALVSIIEMPEMVELFKLLSGGKLPRIVARMRSIGGGETMGYFNWRKNKIALSEAIFRDPEKAKQTFAHEIGHWIDNLGGVLHSDNILSHLSAISQFTKKILAPWPGAPGELTEADRRALRKEAARQAKAGGAGHGGVSNEDIIAIWNNLEKSNPELELYVKKLSGEQKAELVKAAMRGANLPEWFDFNGPDVTEETRRIFNDLLKAEMEKRYLFHRDEIMAELKDLTMRWRPWDDSRNSPRDLRYNAYRHHPQELYADFVSVLFNRPKMAQEVAPKTFELWSNYLQNRPQMAEIWNQLQLRLSQGEEALQDYRYNAWANTRDAGNERMLEVLQRNHGNFRSFWDQAMRALNTERHPWLKLEKSVLKEERAAYEAIGGPREYFNSEGIEGIKFWTEELPYSDSTIHLYHLSVADRVVNPILKKGYAVKDLEDYMFFKSISTEGAQKASPKGHDVTTSMRQLEHLKKKWGPEKYGAIQAAYENYQQIRKSHVMPHVQNSEAWSVDLTQQMIENHNYMRRILLDKMKNKYGEDDIRSIFTGKVYHRLGSFGDVAPGFTATLVQDVALLHASHVNQIKREAIDWLFKYTKPEHNLVRPSEQMFYQGRPIGWLRESPYKGFTLVKYSHLGKLKGAYLADNLASYLNRDPQDFRDMMWAWNKVSDPIKQLLVSHNPGWNVWNIQRDFRESIMKLPGATAPKLARIYPQAFKEAVDEIWRGKVSDDLKAMYDKKMLVAQSVWQADVKGAGNYIEGVMIEMGKWSQQKQTSPYQWPKQLLDMVWQGLGKIGQTVERASKLAGYKYLKQYYPNMGDKAVAHLVRTRVGSPNPYERGAANFIYNEVFPFSNMGKEGYRSHYEAFTQDPWAYSWKFFKWNVIPSIAKWMMMAGAMDFISKWLLGILFGDAMKAIGDRDKANYITLPIGVQEDGKTVYFVLPTDFTAQAILAVAFMWLLPGSTMGNVMKLIAGGIPYSNLHPIINVFRLGYNTLQGEDTTDAWTGRGMIESINPKALEAGGTELWSAAGKAAWNQVASSIYRWSPDVGEKELTSPLEKALKYPIFGSIFNRFIRVSDRGIYDEVTRKVITPLQQEVAQENSNVNRIIDGFLNDNKLYYSNMMTENQSNAVKNKAVGTPDRPGLYYQLVSEGVIKHKKPEGFWDVYKRLSIEKSGSTYSKLTSKGSQEQRGAVERYYREHIPNRINP